MAKIKGPKKTNRYPDEFKIRAVQLADHPDILAKKDVAKIREDKGYATLFLTFFNLGTTYNTLHQG